MQSKLLLQSWCWNNTAGGSGGCGAAASYRTGTYILCCRGERFGFIPLCCSIASLAYKGSAGGVCHLYYPEIFRRAGGLLLLENGSCDLVLSHAALAAWAATDGIGDLPPVLNVRSLGGGLGRDFINIMFPRNFVDRTGINTCEKLLALKYPVKLAIRKDVTMGELTAEKVLQALGVSLQTLKSWGERCSKPAVTASRRYWKTISLISPLII